MPRIITNGHTANVRGHTRNVTGHTAVKNNNFFFYRV